MDGIPRPGAVERFEPVDQAAMPEGERIAYRVRVPRFAERARFRRAVLKAGGAFHSDEALLAEMRRGVEAILTDESEAAKRAELLALLDRYASEQAGIAALAQSHSAEVQAAADRLVADGAAAGLDDIVERLPEELAQAIRDHQATAESVAELQTLLARHWEPLAGKMADREVYFDIAGAVAAQMFLEGWEGIDAPFERALEGASEASLAAIPELHVRALGYHVFALLSPGRAQRKNSRSPSDGRSSPTSSTAAKTSPKTTRSKATHG